MPRKKTIAITIDSTKKKPIRRPAKRALQPKALEDKSYHSYYYLLYGLTGLISLGLIGFSLYAARAEHHKQQATFNLEMIKLEPTNPLAANFIEPNQDQIFTFEFALANNSEYSYSVSLQGQLNEQGEKRLSQTQSFELKPGADRQVYLDLPLAYDATTGVNDGDPGTNLQKLKLTLSTAIAENSLLGALVKDIEKEYPITLRLATDEEIAAATIQPNQTEISLSQAQAPELVMQLGLQNKTSRDFEGGSYEIYLTDQGRKRVQPLLVDQYQLTAREQYSANTVFKFTLPPANQLDPGSQHYLLEITYTGTIGNRKFRVQSYSASPVKITVIDWPANQWSTCQPMLDLL